VAALGPVTAVGAGLPWLTGTVEWRGLRVPLISFERLTGGAGGAPTHNSRAIVLNTLNGNRDLPFIAVLSQRIPRLLLVTARMAGPMEDKDPVEGVLSYVDMQGDEAVIPDIDRIEQLLGRNRVRVERATA
jgi:chemosensory pili system protein ChpC